jgi:hypothetical protein
MTSKSSKGVHETRYDVREFTVLAATTQSTAGSNKRRMIKMRTSLLPELASPAPPASAIPEERFSHNGDVQLFVIA